MQEIMGRLFGPDGMGLCVKNSDKKVLFQNEVCKGICGNQNSQTCEIGCMSLYISDKSCPARSEGVQVFTDQLMHDRYMDVVVLNNARELVTILYPVETKHQRELQFLQDKGLSKRETEIAEMVVRGMTNSDIVKKLAISKATLKTHLNNVYKKLPADSRGRFRRRMMMSGT
ncbi:MAG: hypothetical protein A2X94_06065 [Bdellovibrionales bacterium GWB1_55_8]|nr:MAG: hypothetical protein A2X94_06065 [Bdellovibrionales bacterium GWB1_55_8]